MNDSATKKQPPSYKPLVFLGVIFIAVSIAAFRLSRTKKINIPPPTTSLNVFPDFDPDSIRMIEISGRGDRTVLEQDGETWIVRTLYGYPADPVRVRDSLRDLSDVRVSEFIGGGTILPDPFGLGPQQDVISLRVFGDGEQLLAEATIGEPVKPMASPLSKYAALSWHVRTNGGPIVRIDRPLASLASSSTRWIKQDLLRISPKDIRKVELRTGTGEPVRIERHGGTFEPAEGDGTEEVDLSGWRRLTEALGYLRCDGIADPSLDDATLGFTAGCTCEVTTFSGNTYKIAIGSPAADGTSHYMRIRSEQDDTSAGRLEGWTYLVNASTTERICVSRSDLVRPASPGEDSH